jgi:hypothetical protein
MSELGHFRPNRPAFAFGPCRLRSESDRSAALPQSVAMCHNRAYAVQQKNRQLSPPRDGPNSTGIEKITDEMVRRGCEVVHSMGGIHKNPHFSADQYEAEVREILEVALGLHELDL